VLVKLNLLGARPPFNPCFIYSFIQNYTRYLINHTLVWSEIGSNEIPDDEGIVSTTTFTMETSYITDVIQDINGIIIQIKPKIVDITGDSNFTWLTYGDYGETGDVKDKYTGEVRVNSNANYSIYVSLNTSSNYSTIRLCYKHNDTFDRNSTSINDNGDSVTLYKTLNGSDTLRFGFYRTFGDQPIAYYISNANHPVIFTITKI
jgi:hypothetical protein